MNSFMRSIHVTWLASAALLLSCPTLSAAAENGDHSPSPGCETADLVAGSLRVSAVPREFVENEIARTLNFEGDPTSAYDMTLRIIAAQEILGPCTQEIVFANSTTYYLRSGGAVRYDWNKEEANRPENQRFDGEKTFFKVLTDKPASLRVHMQAVKEAPQAVHPGSIEGRFVSGMRTRKRLLRRLGGAVGYLGIWEVSPSQWDVYAYCEPLSACAPFKVMSSTLPITMVDYTLLPILPHTGLAVMQNDGNASRVLWIAWECMECPGPFANTSSRATL